MSYTQGPWGIEKFSKGSYMITALNAGTARAGLVAQHVPGRANASLIAAAPELYEALEAMQKAVDEFFPEVSEDSTGACLLNRRAILNGAQTRAAKALAKAGGKGAE